MTQSEASRRSGIPPVAKALAVIGSIASIAVAYVMLVWIPERHRLLLEHDLMTFAFRYHSYYAANGHAPSSLADLKASDRTDSLAIAMIRSGEFIIIWNGVLQPDGEANEKYVLGYAATAPHDGGLVMSAGASVEYMTAEQFNAMPKIETKRRD